MSPERPEALTVALLVIGIFEQLGIEYHVGGSYASSIHGVPRQTQNVDLVAALSDFHVEPLIEALTPEFYADEEPARRAIELRSSFNVLHLASGVKVDIFCRGNSAFDLSEFARASSTTIYGEGSEIRLRVKSAEDTILRKLLWFREGGETSERQWHDVLGCLNAQAGLLDSSYLNRWAMEIDVSDLLQKVLRETRK